MSDSKPSRIVRDSRELGVIVRQKRRLDGVTQAELAGLTGIGIRFVSELENGKATAEIGKVFAVLGGLGLSVAISQRSWPEAERYDR